MKKGLQIYRGIIRRHCSASIPAMDSFEGMLGRLQELRRSALSQEYNSIVSPNGNDTIDGQLKAGENWVGSGQAPYTGTHSLQEICLD